MSPSSVTFAVSDDYVANITPRNNSSVDCGALEALTPRNSDRYAFFSPSEKLGRYFGEQYHSYNNPLFPHHAMKTAVEVGQKPFARKLTTELSNAIAVKIVTGEISEQQLFV